MIDVTLRRADEATVKMIDALALSWVVFWLLVGGWFGYMMWQLAGLGDTVSASGAVVESVGEALQSLAAVPVIGEEPARLGADVTTAGVDVASRGQEIKGQLHQVAVLLGLAIAVMPLTLIAGVYLPLRVTRHRELAALRQTLAERGLYPALERYLADQATLTLPFVAVRDLGVLDSDLGPLHPATSSARPSDRDLADAELARLGVQQRPT